MKATKRADNSYILRPSRLRMFLIYTILLILAIGIGFFIRYVLFRVSFSMSWFQTDGPFFLVLIVGGAILISFMEYPRWIMRVEYGQSVEGPSGALGERMTIPLKEIDWTRTRRSLTSWLKFGNAIYTSPRNRILVSPWFFNPREFREFLTLIGYDRAIN